MAPVSRGTKTKPAPSRRASTPTQSRRTAATKPPQRQRQSEEPPEDEDEDEETTAFDASDSDDEESEYDEDNLPEIVDLSAVEATTYEVVPKGRYPGYVDSVEYGLSQSKGLPMLTWILKFDYDDKERTIRFYTTLVGDGAGRTKATLARLDPELDLSSFAPDEADEHFGGMDVDIAVTVRPDREDRKIKRNNVSDIYPLDED